MVAETLEPVNSYYEASSNGHLDAPVVAEDMDADAVVIGGGLTGSSTALHLAEAGVDVIQLEQSHFGWGASGRSGGQIINGYGAEMESLETLLGTERAEELWQHSLNAVEYTETLIDRFSIDCDYQRGYLHVGVKPRHDAELKHWAQHMADQYGYEVMEYWSKIKLREVLGSELYCGAVFDPASGHLHPLNYCLGVASAAAQAGARQFQRSAVTQVTKTGQGFKVVVNDHAIHCKELVYACNAYIGKLAPEIHKKIMPVGTYIVATEPLPETTTSGLISNRAAVSDTNFVLDYYRLSSDNRMLFGGRVSYSTLEPRKLTESLRRRMLRVFPQLAGVQIDYSWGGYVAITQNRAPHIGQQKDGSWFAQGFSGHGMALTGYVGKLLSDACLGDHQTLDCFREIPHRTFPGGRLLRTPALVAAMSYYRMRDHF
ncbi:MAG: FAD-binding oxidoreductase [Pseudomonadota bacterium]